MTKQLKFSLLQARWMRFRRSGLQKPFASSEEAASQLIGIQAQILPAAALSLWNRTEKLTHSSFEEMLYKQRSLVKLWGQRGTLHLYQSQEWPLIYSALSRKPTWWERSADAGYKDAIVKAAALLQEKGSLSRAELREAGFIEDHLSSWGGVFADLVRRGLACHGPQEASEGRLYHRQTWLPQLNWEPPESEAANLSIAKKYFKAYGPASTHDLAYWRGAQLSEARKWVASLKAELTEVSIDGEAQWILQEDETALAEEVPESWPLRMLYRFDPLLLAHKDKSWVVDSKNYSKVWRPAGHIEGVFLENGKAIGTWRYVRGQKSLTIVTSPFSRFSSAAKFEITKKASEVASFFGLPLGTLKL